MFVDDDSAIARLSKLALEKRGYRVEIYTEGQAALEAYQEQPERFDVVVTDQTMPRMTGTQLAKALRAVGRDVPIIVCTGYGIEECEGSLSEELDDIQILEKPIDSDALSSAIEKSLGRA